MKTKNIFLGLIISLGEPEPGLNVLDRNPVLHRNHFQPIENFHLPFPLVEHSEETLRSDNLDLDLDPTNRRPLNIEPFLPSTSAEALNGNLMSSYGIKNLLAPHQTGIIISPSPIDLPVHAAVPGRPVVSSLQPRVHHQHETEAMDDSKSSLDSSTPQFEIFPTSVNISEPTPTSKNVSPEEEIREN